MTELQLPPLRHSREGGWTLIVEEPLAASLLTAGLIPALENPDKGDGPTGRGAHRRLELADGRAVILRRYRHGGMLARLTGERFLGSGRFRREFEVARTAWASGVPTARPVAVGWRGPVYPTRGWIATLAIPGARDMLAIFARPIAATKRVTAARAAARAVRALHDAGIVHADLHLKNLMVGEGPGGPGSAAWVIDLDLARGGKGSLPLRDRISNLARLFRSVEKHRRAGLEIGEADIGAFCEEYFGEDSEGRRAAGGAMGLARLRARVHAKS